MEISNELKPALAAISGGLGDIGRAVAKTLAGLGADIALCDLGPQKTGDAFLEEIGRMGRQGFYQAVDVSDAQAVELWYEKVSGHFGRAPNLIVPNAATVTEKPHLEISAAEWRREIDVNLNGAYYFADSGSRRLVEMAKPGRIVFVGSWAAHAPHRKLPAYCVAKAGIRMLNQTLAHELAAHGILVNEIAPGYVDGGLSGHIFKVQPEIKRKARENVPIRKLITVDEVAQQVVFLCSDLASHMTGSTLLQDGGLSLLRGPFA